MRNIRTRNLILLLLIGTITLISIYFSQETKRKSMERNDLETKLSKMVEMQKSEEIKYIDFSLITNFSWDELFVLGPYTMLDRIPLENQWPNTFPTSIEYSDGIVLFIFVKDGIAVQYLEYGREICDFADSGRMWAYDRNEAKFVVDDKNRCISIQ